MIVALIFMFFTAIMYFIAFMLGVGGHIAIIFALIIAFMMSFAGYWYSDKIVLRLHNARPATPEQDAQLKNILEGLCIAAGMPKPRLYVMEDRSLNAFATGRNPKNGVICVTTGLLDTLDYYQLEGVIAHELAHIKNYDMLLQTIAGIMIGAALIAASTAARMAFFSGRRSSGGGAMTLVILVVGLMFLILAPIAGQLLKMALSRNREYLADATAVQFTRNPEGLASALELIGGSTIPLENSSNATEGMYIVTPCLEVRSKRKKSNPFSTHPPIEKRVEALRNLK